MEKQKSLHVADDNPYLNYDALVEACDKIFGKRQAISYQEFKKLTEESYRIDMEEYARLHNFTDSVKLTEYFSYIRTKIEQSIPEKSRTDRIIVVGCGQGRLSEVYIALAKKMGVKKITFNDLIESHVEQTKNKIQKLYNSNGFEADGVKIEYLPGDILTVDVSEMFDAMFLIWYVSAEFVNPESAQKMVETRRQIYTKFRDILIPGGALIEDIPDPNMEPGFYRIGNVKTAHILEQRKILLGQHQNMLLSNWTCEQKEGFPYQLRYTPRNGTDVKEKESTGFVLKKTESMSIPLKSTLGTDVVLPIIRDSQNMDEVLNLLRQIRLTSVTFPSMSKLDQKRRKMTYWEKSAD
mgnify:CR=1 FL=1